MEKEKIQVWKEEIEPVLNSKAEELQMLGYENVSPEDVWECFTAKLPRIEVPEEVRPHWIVAEVFRLRAHDYMNWLTVAAYKGPDWFKDDEPVDGRLSTRKNS
ncbi:post-transcriptional regulator [Evansella sp. LMS18]|jgi:hypothetical protein|uniref:post-transcriptional regulator n=1 Tax=Evansella sp. LMS18 TaxID=2924033 RepID=UPI0020D19C04|nr:post-transcriptional regulator [Evansella sp. LMS18]UTR09265.1 post-transcriptional regulator [Evansella sp. LMS18]